MRFVWFWTFWHWSQECFRCGALLHSPLQGMSGNWDEWFHHEASANDLQAIEDAGRTESTQRQFIAWLYRYWAREMPWRENRLAPRFALGQLANRPPFNKWAAFSKYRTTYGVGGISAVVLSEESPGEAGDVRLVEALALPSDSEATSARIVSEGFEADSADLDTARRAAMSLLCGKGLMAFLALWIVGGRRPYPSWLKALLGAGWILVAGLIIHLLAGPDPNEGLFVLSAVLVGLWAGLVLSALGGIGAQCFRAWSEGQTLSTRLEQGQVRLRMNGGLTLRGGSAGLPFCLNMVLALHRARPRGERYSWLWHRFFRKLCAGAQSWAATGVIAADGRVRPVVLQPKLRACLNVSDIRYILTPRQGDAGQRAITRLAGALRPTGGEDTEVTALSFKARLGYAAEAPRLRSHRCRHVAQSMMALGGFASTWQKVVNVLAIVVTAAVLLAAPDLRNILIPPSAPPAVAPSSPSPYHLWVSLATKHPECFYAALESGFWSNRRAEVASYGGANASVRAEIRLHRQARQSTSDAEDGAVWIERRHRFLSREFAPGERVGRYSLPYLVRLGHE